MQQKFNLLAASFDLHSNLKNGLFLTLGAFAQILSIDIFLAPSQLSPGGVAGIAIIINQFVNWPIGLIMMAFNIPLLFFGFHYLGRFRFLVNTLYVVLLINLGVDFMAPWLPRHLTDDLLLNALYSAVLGGIGSGLIYRGRGYNSRNRGDFAGAANQNRHSHQPGLHSDRWRHCVDRRAGVWLGAGTLRLADLIFVGAGNRLCAGRPQRGAHRFYRHRFGRRGGSGAAQPPANRGDCLGRSGQIFQPRGGLSDERSASGRWLRRRSPTIPQLPLRQSAAGSSIQPWAGIATTARSRNEQMS